MSNDAVPAGRPGRGVLMWVMIWAVMATLTAVFFGGMTVFLWMQLQEGHVLSQQPAVRARAEVAIPGAMPEAGAAATSGEFEKLQDSDVAGRYRFIQDGEDLGKITLLPNHSIINKDGTTYPRYHWEIQPGGILTRWQRGDILLNVMEKPGVYVARKKDGSEPLRIEKLAP